MLNNSIKYIGFYDCQSNKNENRSYYLSATNKMDYIINTLIKIGYKVEIISPSFTKNNEHYKGKVIKINDNVNLKLFSTLSWKGRKYRLINMSYSFLCLLFYLLFHIKSNETLIVYHSNFLAPFILACKKLRSKLNIILEVEEIYDDIIKKKLLGKMEYILFNSVDKFIFSTDLLNEKLNKSNKPYTVLNGTYQIEAQRKPQFNDGKVHVVYAGTFDPRKGGAIAAYTAAYLPQNYHVHIIGFGREAELDHILDIIEKTSKKTKATITYDGLLKGEDYIKFLQNCDIGLSTQIPDAEYNHSSFPSKILSYMANGLRVVSVRIKAVENSAVGSTVYYYDEQTPESIAKTILQINFDEPYDSRVLLKELDEKFISDMKRLLVC